MAADSVTGSRVHEVTELLRSWRQGDAAALDRLIPLVHSELRRVARSHFRREHPGHTLQATALVHEAYLRLVAMDRMTLNDRTHFFAVAARLMRQILVDHARRKRADKRGKGVTMMSLDEVTPVSQTSIVDVLALDQALDALSVTHDSAVSSSCDFRGSASTKRRSLGVSAATVEREWAMARAWLHRRLSVQP